MTKIDAFNNAFAVFYYAQWRYKDEIISFTSNGITYDVTIQLTKEKYDIEREDKFLRNIISTGARINILEQEDKPYDIYSVLYFFKD